LFDAAPIRLQFAEDVTASVRARMDYVFRVYAAIYGHRVVPANSCEKARLVVYGGGDDLCSSQNKCLRVPALYQPALAKHESRESTRHLYAGEELSFFFGLDTESGRPDWLGEIFRWLSGENEKSIQQRDAVGRIPDSELILARNGSAAWKPNASILMAWLENSLFGEESKPALPKAPSPLDGVEHFIICSHDIDFYFTDRRSALQRLLKNLAIALLQYKSWDFFSANCAMLAGLLKGDRIGDYLPPLISRLEQCQAKSTFFAVPRKAHPRDPNYSIREIAANLREAVSHGFPVEIHGSYTSSIGERTLQPEAAELRNILRKPPAGNRQHWLRFDNTGELFRMVEEAGLRFDSSVGFVDHVGFRSGASFAFPPYNFEKERAYDFLEIPLAIMDGSLVEESRSAGESPQFLTDRVLAESRNRGWGGISILWHNPIEALPVPNNINRIFWNCAAKKESFREAWVSTDEFFALCLGRYQDAGLLTYVRIPEPQAGGMIAEAVPNSGTVCERV